MPNRILKESVCTSDTLDQLTAEEERFFYRLIVNCDDYGRLDARPSILRSKLFPLKPMNVFTDEVICQILARLVETNLIIIYIVENKCYVQLVTWEIHQQVRAKRSKYPEHTVNDNHTLTPDIIRKHLLSSASIRNQMIAYVPVIQSLSLSLSLSESLSNATKVADLPTEIVENLPEKEVTPKKNNPLPDWINPEIWKSFSETRRKLKAPLTEKAIELLIRELTKLKNNGDDPNEVLNQSIMRGWRGVFPLKNAKGETDGADKGYSCPPGGRQQTNDELREANERFRG